MKFISVDVEEFVIGSGFSYKQRIDNIDVTETKGVNLDKLEEFAKGYIESRLDEKSDSNDEQPDYDTTDYRYTFAVINEDGESLAEYDPVSVWESDIN